MHLSTTLQAKIISLDYALTLFLMHLMQVQKMANETGLDFSDQIISLENKYQQVNNIIYNFRSYVTATRGNRLLY